MVYSVKSVRTIQSSVSSVYPQSHRIRPKQILVIFGLFSLVIFDHFFFVILVWNFVNFIFSIKFWFKHACLKLVNIRFIFLG